MSDWPGDTGVLGGKQEKLSREGMAPEKYQWQQEQGSFDFFFFQPIFITCLKIIIKSARQIQHKSQVCQTKNKYLNDS